MLNIDEAKGKRAKLVANMRALLDTAQTEKRDSLNADEEVTYGRLLAEVSAITKRVQVEEEVRQHEESIARITGRPIIPQTEDQDSATKELRSRIQSGFRHYIARDSDDALDLEKTKEFRALSQGISVEGGYLVPQEFSASLIEDVKNETLILGDTTVFPLKTASEVSFPVLAARMQAIQWGGELTQPDLDTALAFGQRTLTPRHGMLRLQVSRKLIRNSAIAIEALIRAEFAYAYAVGMEQAIITGTGATRPLGFMVASASGVSTARDVSTGNSTTAIAADNLINVKYSLKAQYHPRAKWYFHRDAMRDIVKLKDGQGQYLWSPGLQMGQPDMLLGSPVRLSEYMPSTFTTGLYVGAFADLSKYYVIIGLDMELQRLDEIAARTNQVEFILRFEADGAPIREEAFSRVTLA